jgi:hypothetical protein
VLVEHRAEWYGFDPIHIRRPCRAMAWSEMLAPWLEARHQDSVPAPLDRRLCLGPLLAERRWIWGREQHRAQPCCRLSDGTTLSLY